MRLCLEKGYHRPSSDPTMSTYHKEARKRAFWCAYVFDRFVQHLLITTDAGSLAV